MGVQPVARLAGKPRGLAHAATSFVGRSGAVGKVAELLGSYRLVTITGPGGVGKTRLADEVLKQVTGPVRGRYRDRGAGRGFRACAGGCHGGNRAGCAPGRGSVDRRRAGRAAVARRQLLLVLDNCEHVLDAAAQLCAALLSSADDIRILATSREPLGLPEEARYRLASPGAP